MRARGRRRKVGKDGTSILSITSAIHLHLFSSVFRTNERREKSRRKGEGFVCVWIHTKGAWAGHMGKGKAGVRADCWRTIDTDEREAGPEYTMTV